MAVDDSLAPTRLSRRARIVVGVLALAAVLAVVGSAVVLVRERRTERTREILLEAGQRAGLVARPRGEVTDFLAHQVRDVRRISISCEDRDLREVMDDIGRQVGRNIVVEPEIHEKVTISLKKIPWTDAVLVIAKMTKCEVEQRGPVVRSEEH